MSRSGYGDDCDYALINLYRQAVDSAIKGNRGQALLRELEAALLTLPEKKLCAWSFAEPATGQVCALGAVALKRKLNAGACRTTALEEVNDEFPTETEAEAAADTFNIANSLAREITYINDEAWNGSNAETPEHRYERVLVWVRENIKA